MNAYPVVVNPYRQFILNFFTISNAINNLEYILR